MAPTYTSTLMSSIRLSSRAIYQLMLFMLMETPVILEGSAKSIPGCHLRLMNQTHDRVLQRCGGMMAVPRERILEESYPRATWESRRPQQSTNTPYRYVLYLLLRLPETSDHVDSLEQTWQEDIT